MSELTLDANVVRSLFRYEDGILYWRERPADHFPHETAQKKWNTKFSGKAAGYINKPTLDLRIVERRIDVQLPVNLFRLPGHVAVQPEQVVPNNTLHARPLRRGHYRDRVTSQLRVAA